MLTSAVAAAAAEAVLPGRHNRAVHIVAARLTSSMALQLALVLSVLHV